MFHILGSIGFLMMPVLFSPDFNTGRNLFAIRPFQNVFCRQVLLLFFFYLNYYILLPRLFFKDQKLLYVLISIACFYLILKLPDWIFFFERTRPSIRPQFPARQHRRVSRFVMELFGGGIVQFLIIYFSSILMKVNVRMDEMREEKTQAELSYLKAQINPHFLFNTLNSLYALTLEKSDGAPEAVLKLSGIMRYVVSESAQDFVALSKEIQYIKDYIDLQKLRISDNVQFSMQIEGSPDGKRIAPMLLIPFIENAFKYGVNPDEDSVIDIRFVLSDYQLHLTVLNTIAATSFDEQHKTGTGIENVQKRLNLVYPQKHKLQFATQADGMYLVDLKIFLES